ncbi:MAG: hypothetical protein L3K11_08380, partial [Thermoplasmata archaeon]|nr:hypothetical protein [Thermoplasmata archaeon]
ATEAFLSPLPVRAIPGVGPKAEATLQALGIRTIGELRTAEPGPLRRNLGRFADELRALARGRPSSAPVERSGPRQRSVDRTLREDTADPERLIPEVRELSEELHRALVEEKLQFRSVVLRLRWADFQQTQVGRRLPAQTASEATLQVEALRLLRRLLERERTGRARPVRRLSLAVQELHSIGARQRLLDAPAELRTVKPGPDSPTPRVPE